MLPLILLLLPVLGYGHALNYTLSDGSVIGNGTLDKSTSSLLIDVNSTKSGLLALEVPRDMLDTNSSFLVLDDGKIVDYQEQDNTIYRNIIIPYDANSERITITGTHASPEYSTLGLVVASVFIITCVLSRWATK